MANIVFKDDPVFSNLNENIKDIGNVMLQKKLKDQERKQALQDAVELANIKAKAEAENNPDTIMIKSLLGGNNDTPTILGNNNTSANNGLNLDRDKLTRGILSKKFGVPYEEMQTPEERDIFQENKLQESPMYQENKAKRLEDLISTVEQNKIKKDMVTQAQEATGKIPTGLGGKMQMWWNKMFDPENPTMAEWQKVKMVLTDAQLMNTAKTKGAISDKEMELFSKAAANDDIASISAMKPVFNKLVNFMDAEEKSKLRTYNTLYGNKSSQPLFTGKLKQSEQDDPLGLR